MLRNRALQIDIYLLTCLLQRQFCTQSRWLFCPSGSLVATPTMMTAPKWRQWRSERETLPVWSARHMNDDGLRYFCHVHSYWVSVIRDTPSVGFLWMERAAAALFLASRRWQLFIGVMSTPDTTSAGQISCQWKNGQCGLAVCSLLLPYVRRTLDVLSPIVYTSSTSRCCRCRRNYIQSCACCRRSGGELQRALMEWSICWWRREQTKQRSATLPWLIITVWSCACDWKEAAISVLSSVGFPVIFRVDKHGCGMMRAMILARGADVATVHSRRKWLSAGARNCALPL